MASIDDKLAKEPWREREYRASRQEIYSYIRARRIPLNRKTISRVGVRLSKKKWRDSLPIGRDVSITESDSPRLIVYGTCRVGGTITFFHTTNNNQNALFVVSITAHEISDITKLFLDNEQAVFAAVPGFSNSNSFGGKVFFSKSLGSDSQVANVNLAAYSPDKWTADHRQRGVAHAVINLLWDAAYWTEIPDFTFEVNGKKVYDPRDGLTKFTSNAALIIADYLTNARYGYGLTYNDLDTSTNEGGLQWAADICDETVALAGGGTEPRYSINGWFPTGRQHKQILEEMIACMGGHLTWRAGKWRFWPAKWRTPSITLTEADLRSPIRVKTINSRRDIFNSVRGTFVDKNMSYEVTDYPLVKNALYISQDQGEEIKEEIDYPLVTSAATAQRLSKMQLEHIRQGINVQATWSLKAYQLEVPDTVYLTIPRYGWEQKAFRVVELELLEDDSGGAPTKAVYLNLQETGSGTYDWNSGNETTTDLSPNTDLPNPFSVEAVSGLTLESGTDHLYLRSDGTVFSRLYVEWNALSDFFITSGGRIELQYKKVSGSNWQNTSAVSGDSTFAYILDVQDGQSYHVRARSVNAVGVPSAWTTSGSHVVLGKLEPPSEVTGLMASVDQFGITIKWLKVPDLDVKKYIIKIGSIGDSWTDATELATVDTTSYRVSIITSGQYLFYVKALDTSENESEEAAFVIATIINPEAPTGLSSSLGGENITIRWNAVPSTALFAISDYVIAYGNDLNTAVVLATTKALHWAQKVDWGGFRRFWIYARDVAGNIGAAASIDVIIYTPTIVATLTSEVIDNNVLLRWTEPSTHSLPIDYYSIYKGDNFATAVHLGDLKGTFATYFEVIAGTYNYWAVPIDTAGNVGPEKGVPAIVSEPPNFELTDDMVIAPEDFDILINAIVSGDSIICPVNNVSLASKFATEGWSSFDDQIAAGYPIVIEPSAAYCVIEKVIDYGTVLPGTLVKASWLEEILDEDAPVVCTLGYSDDGVSFTETEATQIYAVDFQYIKIRLTIGTVPAGGVSGSPVGALLGITHP